MSCLPLAKVVEEPHAAANICGVVHSILDGVTKRAGKRRVEMRLVPRGNRAERRPVTVF